MTRPVAVVLALGLAACGETTDDRPATLENITQAILAPNCGNAQCHSSFRRADRYAFDTVANARESLADGLVIPGEPADSQLILVLTSPGGEDNPPRMPYDQPLPDRDLELIVRWIERGAPGL